MNFLGNLLWLIFGGLLISFVYFVIGILLCITIIGIPFGLQVFKLAELTFLPFGKEVNLNFEKHPIANILWVIFVGIETAIASFIFGGILFITIIGIPFAK